MCDRDTGILFTFCSVQSAFVMASNNAPQYIQKSSLGKDCFHFLRNCSKQKLDGRTQGVALQLAENADI